MTAAKSLRPDPPVPSAPVRRLMAEAPVFDAHADSIGRALDLGHDLGRSGPGHLDLERGRQGGLGAWVVVCWVDPVLYRDRPFERASAMLDATRDLARRHPARFRLVRNGRELAQAQADGCIAGIPGMEGGHPLEGSLEKLQHFFERGLRVLTLVWNNHLPWVRSCRPEAPAGTPAGLSDFGRQVVRELNRLGVVVDLSHAGDRSFYDALETSTQPVIASHSGCRSLHDHPRNLDDPQLRALADQGGVCGIVFYPSFLDAEACAEDNRLRDTPGFRALRAESEAELFLERQRYLTRESTPLPAARLVQHIEHAVEVAGIDHVGLGSDFDGIECGPQWIEDASCYPILAELLVQRGFGIDDVRKVLGGNMRRVFEQVTAR